ncbi:MAG: hypothetical protein KAT16_01335 [Candidatus Heimdallarchaeota archaeon]|nr:hypothetical protein [Candidatus Heimdallarchaeota archaeon]
MNEDIEPSNKNFLMKILTEPNFFKALPILFLPTIIATSVAYLFLDLLPENFTGIVGLNNIGSLGIGTLILVVVWLYYRNSLYFRISVIVIILVAVSVIMTRVNELLGNIAVENSLGEFLLQSVPAGLFIAVSVVYLVFMIQKPLSTLMNDVNNVSKGELLIDSSKNLGAYGSEFAEFEESFSKMVYNISLIVKAAQNTIERVAATSEELATTSEEVNALTEEVTSTVQQISHGASKQSEIAAIGLNEVRDMTNNIDKSLSDITQTLQVIEEIASQTNILALNAAIEAARAGEYGRGFAVVADNVRRLAEETKKNSSDINTLTDEITSNISSNVISLQESLQSFAAQSEEFSASSEEVAATSEEQAASMHQLTQSANDLTKLSDELTEVIQQFKIDNN